MTPNTAILDEQFDELNFDQEELEYLSEVLINIKGHIHRNVGHGQLPRQMARLLLVNKYITKLSKAYAPA